MIARSLLVAAAIALSAGSASAVTYSANQGLDSDGDLVVADRSDFGAVSDGDAGTFFSLGIGGTLSANVSPNKIGGAQVIEITNNTPNDNYKESAVIWFGGSVDSDGVFDSTGAIEFAEIFNTENPSIITDMFGTIVRTVLDDSTIFEISLSQPHNHSLITLVDTTWDNYGGEYTTVSDGFDVGELSVSAVPLPASVLMLMGALGGLGLIARRRNADA